MTSIVSPGTISESAFRAALARYPAVIKAVSDAKGAKTGQQTLEELDKFRYATAPARFGPGERREAMSLEDIKTLVAWKLKHGKFRPTLMKLVESNDKATAESTVKAALDAYEASLKASQASKGGKSSLINAHAHASTVAVGILSRLRGIGPATASLLAAVHYPQQTIFFSDEAYAWLCGASGSSYQRPSKYNDKEYAALTKAAAELMIRLDTTAQDVEQVAYVMISGSSPLEKEKKVPSKVKKTAPKAKNEDTEKPEPSPQDRKRKQPPTEAPSEAPTTRRSSRLRSG